MAINPLGLVAALTAFLSIWIGHVAVRKVEAAAARLWIPMTLAALAGTALLLAALRIPGRSVSMACGITGMALLWDVLELQRQARRVRIGHAPANPKNPRHAATLAALHIQTSTSLGGNLELEGKKTSHERQPG